MQVGTVVLCDSASLTLAAPLEAVGFDVLGVSHRTANWVADCSVSIMQSSVTEPVVLVAAGHHCDDLPAVGWARRSARRPAGAYILINPTTTPAHRGQGDGDWPDAPVIVLTNGGDNDERQAVMQARLRGWTVLSFDDPAATLIEALNS